jgi:hypothetical protein
MSNKSEWQFIVCAILFIVMGVIAFGSIVGPDSVRDFVRDFRKALFVLVAIPLLVIVWWDTHVQASKKRLYVFCVFAVWAAATTLWSLWLLRRSTDMIIDKAYSIAMPLWLLAMSLIQVIKYTKATKARTDQNNK